MDTSVKVKKVKFWDQSNKTTGSFGICSLKATDGLNGLLTSDLGVSEEVIMERIIARLFDKVQFHTLKVSKKVQLLLKLVSFYIV